MSEAQDKKKELSYNRKWANFWGVCVRTITEWKGMGVEWHKVESVAAFAATRQRPSPNILKKLGELGGQKDVLPGVTAADVKKVQEDPDWTPLGSDATPEDFLGYYARKLTRAVRSLPADPAGEKFLSDQVIRWDKAVREHQLLADKLGLESGEAISKAEAERWFRAWGFWAMRDIDATLATACPKLAGLAPGLTVEAVRAVLEPELLEARMLRAFVQATKVESPLTVPEWVVETVKDTVDDYIENGREQFQKALLEVVADKPADDAAKPDLQGIP